METTNTKPTEVMTVTFSRKMDAAGRRVMDIIAATIGLLVLSPIFMMIAVFIKRDSPGPIFYFGSRVGRHGKPFKIIKFRTMYDRPASYEGPRITAIGDCRITPFGRWLRDTKTNELPQLLNVLVGEMALVGPRPEDPEIVHSWTTSLRKDLLSVRPGITSPATIMFRNEETLLHSSNVMDEYLKTILPDKLRLDRNYIHNRSLLTDLDILFLTLLLLLPKLREAKIPESNLYWGPIARFASRNLNWFLIDMASAFLAVGVAAFSWRLGAPFNIGVEYWIAIAVAVAFGFGVINAGLGLTRIQWRHANFEQVLPLAFSSVGATLILILIDNLFMLKIHLPLSMLIITGGLSFTGFTFTRYRERLFTGLASFWLGFRKAKNGVGERVLIIGAGDYAELAIWFLTHSDAARLFSIVGIVDDDPRKQDMWLNGVHVIGTIRDLPALVEKHKVGLTIFTIANIDGTERQRILRSCQAAYNRVVIFTNVMAELGTYFQPINGLVGEHGD
jgi:lipopolysaccharide/colanic/teichoic acid biosynthesis glycosyltransferase